MGSHARPDWTPEEIEKLKGLCESAKHSFAEIAVLMKRPMRGVMYKTYERGFRNPYVKKIYDHDRTFFSRITPETCYWAGVMVTDGYVSRPELGPVIVLVAAIKDLDHVTRFKDALKATNPVRFSEGPCKLSTRDKTAINKNCRLQLDSAQELIDDLKKNFGITCDKTLRCPPPVLPDTLHKLCYLRGFIDGDGTITQSATQLGFMQISVCGCNREMIMYIKDFIDSLDIPHIHPAKRPSLIRQGDSESCYYFSLRGFRAAVLLELLRRTPTPNLERKWNNPTVIRHVDFWKEQASRWPSEAWFENRLNSTTISVSEVQITPSAAPVYPITLPAPASAA